MDFNTLQALMEGASANAQRQRAEEQMTLGKLIDMLASVPGTTPVANLHCLHSYRGYYCDLSLELSPGTRHAADLLAECQNVMGQVFEGYKGGEYVMGARTPLWVADYGCTGDRLMAVYADGSIETASDDDVTI